MQAIDALFSKIKFQGDEQGDEGIVQALSKASVMDGELGRRLMELQADTAQIELSIEQSKQAIHQGVRYSMKLKKAEEERTKLYKTERKELDSQMTTMS